MIECKRWKARFKEFVMHPSLHGKTCRLRKPLAYLLWVAIALGLLLGQSSGALKDPIVLIDIDGIINPPTAEHILKGLEKAKALDAQAVIIRLDTPGGLDASMRIIIKEMLRSPIPIIVFVGPGGSRAASAGTFITLAAHVAAMAPGTNIGAASPVAMGGAKMDETMAKKIKNDAAAYIRSIARKRGRNVDWAEKAVRESVSISETEAVKKNVVDLLAVDVKALLLALDGRTITTSAGKVRLDTRGAELITFRPSYRHRFLTLLSNPNIAYLLMLLGFWGLFFELSNPGAIFPGIIGGICLLLSFYALQIMPINWAGLLLILLAVVLFLLEIKVPSFGALTIGGTISFILGSVMLIDRPEPYLRISLKLIIPAALATAGFFSFLVGMVIRAHRRPPVSGREGLMSELGVMETVTPTGFEGKVFMRGELWDAISQDPLKKGDSVRVVGIEGLRLTVKKEE